MHQIDQALLIKNSKNINEFGGFPNLPADARGSDEHDGPLEVRPGEQPGNLLVRRDLLPVEVFAFCKNWKQILMRISDFSLYCLIKLSKRDQLINCHHS